MMDHHPNADMRACIDDCLDCYKVCFGEAMRHALDVGSSHSKLAHIKLMMACSEMCRTSAHFMLIGTGHHKHTCRECAEICTQCAAECERLGGMEACAVACRKCASSCEKMAA